MTSLVLDINLVNPALHDQYFNYPSGFGLLEFHHITDWRNYLLGLQIRSAKVPTIHSEAYHAALRMLLLAWVEPTVIKPAELQALQSLEGALIGMYFQPVFEREQVKHEKTREKCGGCKKCLLCATLVRDKFRPGLDKLLNYMVAHDGLDPVLHSASKNADGGVLSIIRNALAHGDIFNGLPWGGLFEAVREVMEHAYMNRSLTQTGLSHDRK